MRRENGVKSGVKRSESAVNSKFSASWWGKNGGKYYSSWRGKSGDGVNVKWILYFPPHNEEKRSETQWILYFPHRDKGKAEGNVPLYEDRKAEGNFPPHRERNFPPWGRQSGVKFPPQEDGKAEWITSSWWGKKRVNSIFPSSWGGKAEWNGVKALGNRRMYVASEPPFYLLSLCLSTLIIFFFLVSFPFPSHPPPFHICECKYVLPDTGLLRELCRDQSLDVDR